MKARRGVVLYIAVLTAVLTVTLVCSMITSHIATIAAVHSAVASRATVIIDAGHGGIDGGAVSCTGAYESHINLQIALKLQDLFNLLGVQTKMIRTEDVSIYTSGQTIAAKKVSDLKERTRIINSTDNAILISIHQNYFTDDRYSGAQVFYNGTNSDLAALLQKNFIATINPTSHRKIKQSKGIYLMDNITCPAALIECGFLSHPKEECLLRSTMYQQKICSVIASTVSCFISNNLTQE